MREVHTSEVFQPILGPAEELSRCLCHIQCTAPGCRNLARVIVRRIAEGSAPEGQSELCNRDARAAVEEAKANAIAVHDMRG